MTTRWQPLNRVSRVRTPSPPRAKWYVWLGPSTGVAALIVSLISASVSLKNYALAAKNHSETIAPKVSVTQLSLTHPPRGKAADLPVVAFQVQNRGALTLTDVHTHFTYQYRRGPNIDLSKPAFPISSNNEGVEAGSILIPGDWLDKSEAIFNPFVETSRKVKINSSYRGLTDGLDVLEIEVNTESTDTSQQRIVTCDKFEYVWLTQKFERRGLCIPWDVTASFRTTYPPGGIVKTELPRDSRIPKVEGEQGSSLKRLMMRLLGARK